MRTTQKIIIALWWTALGCLPAQAGDVQGLITDASGKPVANAVIALYGRDAAASVSVTATATATVTAPATAAMDQRDRQFAPHVLVVQRGTDVRFPNSDDIRHQVYSFSPAKTFSLPLYHGVPANPLRFDQAGEVVLGCNIHDRMLGYIYVVETPWFGKSDAAGALNIGNVPAGSYRARLWYPGLAQTAVPIEKTVQVTATGSVSVSFDNAVAESLPEPQPTTTRSWGERRERSR